MSKVVLSLMVEGGAPLTEPLTPSEIGSLKPCRLKGEPIEIGESPTLVVESVNQKPVLIPLTLYLQ